MNAKLRGSAFGKALRPRVFSRYQSTNSVKHNGCLHDAARTKGSAESLPPHSLLPTGMLLRSMLIATVSAHRTLLSPALSILSFFAKPRSALLSIERNPLLHSIFKSTLYKHFCAGENAGEVKNTIKQIKDMGFKGVILTYAREVVVDSSTEQEVGVGAQELKEQGGKVVQESEQIDAAIEAWRQGVLETVSMVGAGDFLALKFTGAGAAITDALSKRKPLPKQMQSALDEICSETLRRRAAILVDAEQQFVQKGIDDVAIELMRKYNTAGEAVIYNTYQAYLKATPDVLAHHLSLAASDGFTIGVKLVRGAYMTTEPRHLINDTKQGTDDAYNSLAAGLMQGQVREIGTKEGPKFPHVQLFLATHNKESALKACELQKSRASANLPVRKVQYGQLLGMADEVSCTLLQRKDLEESKVRYVSPEVYKCLSWGTLGDCISYLLRRAVENRDAVERTKVEYLALRGEVWRRLKGSFRL